MFIMIREAESRAEALEEALATVRSDHAAVGAELEALGLAHNVALGQLEEAHTAASEAKERCTHMYTYI